MRGAKSSLANRPRTCGDCRHVPESFTRAECRKGGGIVTPGTRGCSWGFVRREKPAQCSFDIEGTEMTTLYKILAPGRKACHGGEAVYPKPVGKRPGKWMPKIDDIRPCARGYHVVTAEQLLGWLDRKPLEVWEVEIKGRTIDHDDKVVPHREAVRLQVMGACAMTATERRYILAFVAIAVVWVALTIVRDGGAL